MMRTALYRTIWRWHFYAGLFVLPFVLILAMTGAIYLFKPQIDRWEERAFQGLPTVGAVSPNSQLDTALAAFPGARFDAYRLPERSGDAAMIHLALVDEKSSRDVFVSPQGRLLGCIDPESRLIAWDRKIHGELLSGKWGERLVELVGSWAIVMVLSGLYLWWPVKDGTSTLAGVVWPRLSRGRQAMWRDLHAVTGFWVSGLALVLLITALPWAGVWGDSFKLARRELGWGSERPDWKIGGGDTDMSVGHDHYAMIAPQERGIPLTSLAGIVASAKAQSLAFPVMIKPPGTPDRTGDTNGVWTVKSEAQNRPLTVTITYDLMTGKELSRRAFADKHPIDQAIGYGITWHEGQLFGWINQLVGLLTTVALVALVISGFILWRRRRPQGQLGAPRTSHVPARMGGVVAIMLVLAALLPMLALSLFGLWIFDWLILPRAPRLAAWLG